MVKKLSRSGQKNLSGANLYSFNITNTGTLYIITEDKWLVERMPYKTHNLFHRGSTTQPSCMGIKKKLKRAKLM